MTTSRTAAIAIITYLCASAGSLEAGVPEKGLLLKKNSKSLATLATTLKKGSSTKSADQAPRSGCMPDGMCALLNGGSVVLYEKGNSASTPAENSKRDSSAQPIVGLKNTLSVKKK